MSKEISRRSLLTGLGASLGGVGLGAIGGFSASQALAEASGTARSSTVPFRGEHQSGITTPAQQQMIMVAFDMTVDSRKDLIKLMEKWTLAAERMMAGELINAPKARADVPPDDTGEAMGLGPHALSVTFGFGATLFEHPDKGDRFGLASKMPAALRTGIPRMAAEKLDPERSDGDLVVQLCAEDPMVVLHAMHNFKRIAFGTATIRWMQLGYGRTSSTSKEQETPRNLFGFKDGTANLKTEDSSSELNEHLWIQPSDDCGEWAAGGTYLCIRKIHMMMEVWDELSLNEQERSIGRDKLKGAPLSGGSEFSKPDFEEGSSSPAIDVRSHVALVHPDHNNGRKMLRRGYNYTEGVNNLGRLNAGLFFIAFVRDPAINFTPILAMMARDLLTQYLQHLASAMFIVLPGVREGDSYVGQNLLEG